MSDKGKGGVPHFSVASFDDDCLKFENGNHLLSRRVGNYCSTTCFACNQFFELCDSTTDASLGRRDTAMAQERPCRNLECPYGGLIECNRGKTAQFCQGCAGDRTDASNRQAHERFVLQLEQQGIGWNEYCADNKDANPNYKRNEMLNARKRRKDQKAKKEPSARPENLVLEGENGN